MNNNQEEELIEKYILNQLPENEKRDVDNRLKMDQEFKEKFVNLLSIKQGIRYNTLKGKKTFLMELEQKKTANNKNGPLIISMLNIKKILLAASFISVVALIVFYYNNSVENKGIDYTHTEKVNQTGVSEKETDIVSTINNDSLTQKKNPGKEVNNNPFIKFYSKPEFIASIFRSEEENMSLSELNQAIKLFEEEKYKECLQIISLKKELNAVYLKAHCLFQLKQYKKAEVFFRQLSEDEYFEMQKEAQWYLLLTYLNQVPEKSKIAKIEAEKILNDNDSIYYNKAKEILKILKE